MRQPAALLKKLAAQVRGRCLFDEPMSRHTSFRIGGPADLLVIPADEADLQSVLSFLERSGAGYLVLGNGTNLLVLDGGVRGVTIKVAAGFRTVETAGSRLKAGAGHPLPGLVEHCRRLGLSGLEWAAGIPGSVGGALVMNAGAYGGQISDLVTKVWGYLPSGDRLTIPARKVNFGYRHAEYPEGFVIAGAELDLQPGSIRKISAQMNKWMDKRRKNQPLSLPSAGCIFKNPDADSARRLIGVAGMRGKTLGRARVSTKHANFIVNLGGARASEVLRLVELVRSRTRKELEIDLVPEIKTVGEP
jgi:UDP-N-acetylmuramate dehydrogenase